MAPFLARRRRSGARRLDPRPRTFAADEMQERLDLDGYVVVDLLDEDGVAAFLQDYEALDHAQDRGSPFSEGFHTTMYDRREDYRRAVLAAFTRHVGPAICQWLPGHQILVANFAVKLPHSDSVPLHLDWTFVDETRFRSVGVWCALVDTHPDNGALGVVVGSHRRPAAVRPVNDRVYEDVEGSSGAADRVLLPLRAGQAIVYDSRTVHYSLPNHTDRTRVAAACIVAPAAAERYHYWLDEDGRMMRFEVSEDFYLSYVIGRDPAEASGVVAAVHVG